MKKLRKLLALVLVVCMVCAVSTTAWAEETAPTLIDIPIENVEELVKAYYTDVNGNRISISADVKLQKVVSPNRSNSSEEQYVLTGTAEMPLRTIQPRGSDSGDDVGSSLDARITAAIYFTHFPEAIFEDKGYRLDSANATFYEGPDVHMGKTVHLGCGTNTYTDVTVSGSRYSKSNINFKGSRAWGEFTGEASSWGTSEFLEVSLASPIF